MTATLTVMQTGPSLSLQDMGRHGFRAQGLTQGGAADFAALHEGAALLNQKPSLAALEMVGMGGTFVTDADIRIALTGAVMTATLEGAPLRWNASHTVPKGAKLVIGGAKSGTYGYLHVGGGFAAPVIMGSRASHLSAGLGRAIKAGDALPLGTDSGGDTGLHLPPVARFGGGTVRVVSSMQTQAFSPDTRARFEACTFTRDSRANRMGVRMDPGEAEGFSTDDQLSIVSEVIVPGDIQITGDGAPFVLMCECQTTGGYPRIGTVIPCDLPRIAQAEAGASITFEFVTMEQAIALQTRFGAELAALPRSVAPFVRDPATMQNLLSFQLVSGVISARADPFDLES